MWFKALSLLRFIWKFNFHCDNIDRKLDRDDSALMTELGGMVK